MADENLYSLLIRVEGGDAAAAEIIKSKYALRQVEDENDAIREKFQHGFQHVALKGFIADAGHAVGLGGELRPIISLLNTGITALGASMGFAAGPIGLVIAGLGALAGLAVVVTNHFHKHAEALDDVITKQTAALKTTRDLADSLKAYGQAVGGLPPQLQALQKATQDLDKVQTELATHTMGEAMAAAQRAIATEKERISTLEAGRATSIAMAQGVTDIGQRTAQITEINRRYDEAIRATTGAISAQNQKYEELKQNIKAVGEGYASAKDKVDKLKTAHDQAVEAARKHAEEEQKAADKAQAVWDKERDAEIRAQEEIGKQFDRNMKHLELQAKATANTIGQEFGRVFSDIAFKHQSMSQIIQHETERMAQAMVSKIVSALAQAAIQHTILESKAVASLAAQTGATDALGLSLAAATKAAIALDAALAAGA